MRTITMRTMILTILLAMAGTGAAIFFMSAPLDRLVGESAYSYRGAFHGLLAGVLMITMTVGLFQAFRLWTGGAVSVEELEAGSLVNAAACFMTIVLGNWIYIPYRAKGGPRSYFLETAPEVHKIFFEFKEFAALLTLPLAVGAAFLICRYGQRLPQSRVLRETAALLLVLAFFYFMVAFGLGAAVTKLKAV